MQYYQISVRFEDDEDDSRTFEASGSASTEAVSQVLAHVKQYHPNELIRAIYCGYPYPDPAKDRSWRFIKIW